MIIDDEGCEDDDEHAHDDDDYHARDDTDGDDDDKTQGAVTNHRADIAVLTLSDDVHLSK